MLLFIFLETDVATPFAAVAAVVSYGKAAVWSADSQVMKTVAPATPLLLPAGFMVMIAVHVNLLPSLVGPVMTAGDTLKRGSTRLQAGQQADAQRECLDCSCLQSIS